MRSQCQSEFGTYRSPDRNAAGGKRFSDPAQFLFHVVASTAHSDRRPACGSAIDRRRVGQNRMNPIGIKLRSNPPVCGRVERSEGRVSAAPRSPMPTTTPKNPPRVSANSSVGLHKRDWCDGTLLVPSAPTYERSPTDAPRLIDPPYD